MVDRPRRPQAGDFALGYTRVSTDEQGENYSLLGTWRRTANAMASDQRFAGALIAR